MNSSPEGLRLVPGTQQVLSSVRWFLLRFFGLAGFWTPDRRVGLGKGKHREGWVGEVPQSSPAYPDSAERPLAASLTRITLSSSPVMCPKMQDVWPPFGSLMPWRASRSGGAHT